MKILLALLFVLLCSCAPVPTSTPVPPSIPPDWKTYESITHRFAVSYPPQWSVSSEKPEYAILLSQEGTSVLVGFDSFAFSADSSKDLNKYVEYVLGNETQTVNHVQPATWDDGVHKGVQVIYAAYGDVNHARFVIGFPVSGTAMHLIYDKAGTILIQPDDVTLAKQISASVRLLQ